MDRLAALPHTTAIVAVRCIPLGARGLCPLCFFEAAVARRLCASASPPGWMRPPPLACAPLPQSAPCVDRGGSRRPHATLQSGSYDGAPPHTAPPWSAPSLRDPPRLWRRRTAVCAGGKRRAAATQAIVGRGAMPFFGIVRPHRTGDDCCSLLTSHWSWAHPARRATAARRFGPVAGWRLVSTALRSRCGTGAFPGYVWSLKASRYLA